MNILELIDPIVNMFNASNIDFIFKIIIRLSISILISVILGVERANKRHAAGLRTFMIVSLSATVAGLLDYYLINNYNLLFPALSVSLAIGIAIISGYTILYSSRNQIKGLTTASALWSVAFIGIVFGYGLYTVGIIAGIILILLLSVLPKLEIRLKNRSNHFEIHLELKNKTDLSNFIQVIRNLGLTVDDIESNPAYLNSGLSVYTISLSIYSKELKKYKTHDEIIEALKSIEYISHIEEISL